MSTVDLQAHTDRIPVAPGHLDQQQSQGQTASLQTALLPEVSVPDKLRDAATIRPGRDEFTYFFCRRSTGAARRRRAHKVVVVTAGAVSRHTMYLASLIGSRAVSLHSELQQIRVQSNSYRHSPMSCPQSLDQEVATRRARRQLCDLVRMPPMPTLPRPTRSISLCAELPGRRFFLETAVNVTWSAG